MFIGQNFHMFFYMKWNQYGSKSGELWIVLKFWLIFRILRIYHKKAAIQTKSKPILSNFTVVLYGFAFNLFNSTFCFHLKFIDWQHLFCMSNIWLKINLVFRKIIFHWLKLTVKKIKTIIQPSHIFLLKSMLTTCCPIW